MASETLIAVDREGRQLAGPMSLEEALAHSEAICGLRVAVSSPNGDWMAVQVFYEVWVRRLCEKTGRDGSVLETGEWMAARHCPVNQWRPG